MSYSYLLCKVKVGGAERDTGGGERSPSATHVAMSLPLRPHLNTARAFHTATICPQ